MWVEYSATSASSRSVDFENGTVTLELATEAEAVGADPAALREKLSSSRITNCADAFARDVVAQAVEKRSVAELENVQVADVPNDPILLPHLLGVEGEQEALAPYVDEIVDHMLANRKTSSAVDKRGKTVHRIEVPLEAPPRVLDVTRAMRPAMAPEGISTRAAAFWDHVQSHSKAAGVDRALVYAVMETESNFLPTARSHIPAFGLMQIVPGSAGKDVTQRLFGEPRILSESYLYVPDNNIQAGATYLDILAGYFAGIENAMTRLYCMIAGYNAGPGTVAGVVSGEKTLPALARAANALSPQQVHERLMEGLPDETKHYLEKVDRLRKRYEEIGV